MTKLLEKENKNSNYPPVPIKFNFSSQIQGTPKFTLDARGLQVIDKHGISDYIKFVIYQLILDNNRHSCFLTSDIIKVHNSGQLDI